MEKKAQNLKLISAANKISKAVEADVEEVLRDAEEIIRKYIPARYVKAALNKLEKQCDMNGLEVTFPNKTVTKEALKKTASVNYTTKEIHEAIDHVGKAVVAEVNDSLNDADEILDRLVGRFKENDRQQVEAKVKGLVERRLRSVGIICKFARKTYDEKEIFKKAVAAIKAARKKKVAASKETARKSHLSREARAARLKRIIAKHAANKRK